MSCSFDINTGNGLISDQDSELIVRLWHIELGPVITKKANACVKTGDKVISFSLLFESLNMEYKAPQPHVVSTKMFKE